MALATKHFKNINTLSDCIIGLKGSQHIYIGGSPIMCMIIIAFLQRKHQKILNARDAIINAQSDCAHRTDKRRTSLKLASKILPQRRLSFPVYISYTVDATT